MPGLAAAPAEGEAFLDTCRLWVLGISHKEVSFDQRDFATGDATVREGLERVGGAFVDGYNLALQTHSLEALMALLRSLPIDLVGFAHEGAAMALTLLDQLMPLRRSRWRRLADAAANHIYLTHVGAGWGLARMHRKRIPTYLRSEPLLRPLLYDGFGFHEGFFHVAKTIRQRKRPRLRERGATRAFDQGVGRSLWFVECADAGRIANTIAAFELERHADLWSGIGLAAAYAGCASRETLEALAAAAAGFEQHVAQGVAFAARARQRAENLTQATELAANVFCDVDAATAAAVAEEAARGLPDDGSYDTYECWRARIRDAFRRETQ
jgi:hypothetical protein